MKDFLRGMFGVLLQAILGAASFILIVAGLVYAAGGLDVKCWLLWIGGILCFSAAVGMGRRR